MHKCIVDIRNACFVKLFAYLVPYRQHIHFRVGGLTGKGAVIVVFVCGLKAFRGVGVINKYLRLRGISVYLKIIWL